MSNQTEQYEFSILSLKAASGNASGDRPLLEFHGSKRVTEIKKACRVISKIADGQTQIEANTLADLHVQLMRIRFFEKVLKIGVSHFRADSKVWQRGIFEAGLLQTKDEIERAKEGAAFVANLANPALQTSIL